MVLIFVNLPVIAGREGVFHQVTPKQDHFKLMNLKNENNMDFSNLIMNRYSVRSYLEKEVPKELLLKVLEAGRQAPSAVNYQPLHFVIITDPGSREQLHTAYSREWFKQAPAYIVICSDHAQSWKRQADGKDFADVDAAIAIDHMTLQAAEMGLGTCWVCNFNPGLCRELLALPDHIEPVAILPIGYPAGEQAPRKRKPLDELVHWNRF